MVDQKTKDDGYYPNSDNNARNDGYPADAPNPKAGVTTTETLQPSNPRVKHEGPKLPGIPMSGMEYDPSDPRTATRRDTTLYGQQYYQGKPVTYLRDQNDADKFYNADWDQIVIRLDDGTDKVVRRTDITWPTPVESRVDPTS